MFDVNITFNSGANFVLPRMTESFVNRLHFAKGRNEIFVSVDGAGNEMVIDTSQVAMLRSLKTND